MALRKLAFNPGVNRENTRYANEDGWFDCDKVRFRAGLPEKIGGWERISDNTFLGIARTLFNWVTLGNQNLLGVGTNLKFYIENHIKDKNKPHYRRLVSQSLTCIRTLTVLHAPTCFRCV